MHNLDWSQFTVFDHLIACLMIAGFVLFAVFVPSHWSRHLSPSFVSVTCEAASRPLPTLFTGRSLQSDWCRPGGTGWPEQ